MKHNSTKHNLAEQLVYDLKLREWLWIAYCKIHPGDFRYSDMRRFNKMSAMTDEQLVKYLMRYEKWFLKETVDNAK